MADLGRIIIIGEDCELMHPLYDFIIAEGYHCLHVRDLLTAKAEISANQYDLVIFGMEEGNEVQVNFIEEISREKNNIAIIIIVTTSFSSDFMFRTLNLPVMAYLTKPIDYSRLKKNISDGIQVRQVIKTTRSIRDQIREWDKQLEIMESTYKRNPRYATFLPVGDFMDVSFCNILNIIKDIRFLAKGLVNPNVEPEACHMMDCPRLMILNNALHETVDVLELTKNAFKSRELGMIRKKLENIMNGNIPVEKLSKVTLENVDIKSSDRLR